MKHESEDTFFNQRIPNLTARNNIIIIKTQLNSLTIQSTSQQMHALSIVCILFWICKSHEPSYHLGLLGTKVIHFAFNSENNILASL